MTKLTMALPPGEWHGFATESLWAERVGEGLFRLWSVPFYARGVSYGDVLRAEVRNELLTGAGVAVHSGHSTYRAFLNPDLAKEAKTFEFAWAPLGAIGCTYERATERLIAVDVPPSADVRAAYALLESGEKKGYWDFEEGHCGHALTQPP